MRWIVVGVVACGPGARPTVTPEAIAPAPETCGATPDTSPAIPAAMYAPLFDDGASLVFQGEIIAEDDDYFVGFHCVVGDVRRYPNAIGARLRCASDDVPLAGTPAGDYVATADGLFRVRDLPAAGTTPTVDDTMLMIRPVGEPALLEGDGETGQWIRQSDAARWCHDEVRGEGWPEDGLSVSLCFRPGGGVVAGAYAISVAATEELHRGRWALVAFGVPDEEPPPDVPSAHRTLAINELVAAGDWFEVVNLTDRDVLLDDFVYTDRPQDHARAIAFPRVVLGPGAYHLQRVDHDVSGFRLGAEESLTIYRRTERTVEDAVAWEDGDAPAGGSFARLPDRRGAFRTMERATPCAPNRE